MLRRLFSENLFGLYQTYLFEMIKKANIMLD